jgi:hypothetical protein
MTYELWDIESGNLVETFADQDEALHAARELIVLNAPAYPAALTLNAVDPEGELSTVAEGEALATLVADAQEQQARRRS